MDNFRIGDFIRLKNLAGYQIDRFSGRNINIFEINNIEPEYVELNNCKEKIPISEIESIPINGKDDFEIYYDPILAASVVFQNDPKPIRKTDYTYYFDTFKRCSYQNKNYQEIIKEERLQFVHQIQHFLFDKFLDKGLRIDAF